MQSCWLRRGWCNEPPCRNTGWRKLKDLTEKYNLLAGYVSNSGRLEFLHQPFLFHPRSWDGTTLTLTVPDPSLAEIVQARVGIQATRILAALYENPDAGIIITLPINHTPGGYQHAER